jgi:adenylylsulfate reductase subunit B
MSIKIDKNKCISCGKCANICPGNLICVDENRKACIKYPKDCWGCTACLKECHVSAINMYLGEDIGGKGGYLFTSEENKDYLNWHIVDKNGKEQVIKINRKESNKY